MDTHTHTMHTIFFQLSLMKMIEQEVSKTYILSSYFLLHFEISVEIICRLSNMVTQKSFWRWRWKVFQLDKSDIMASICELLLQTCCDRLSLKEDKNCICMCASVGNMDTDTKWHRECQSDRMLSGSTWLHLVSGWCNFESLYSCQ